MTFATDSLAWYALGANVLPIRPGAKKPLVSGWGKAGGGPCLHSVDSPKLDRAVFDRWRADYPSANTAIFPASIDACVVDVDNMALLDAVLEICGPTDYQTHSPREGGGVHLWYRGASKSCNAITKGVDVKSTGAYVLAPGSVRASASADSGVPRYKASPALAGALASGKLDLPPMHAGWRDALAALQPAVDPKKTDLRILADKLSASNGTRTLGSMVRKLAAGEAFAEPGEREQAIFHLVGRLFREWPTASADAIVALFARSAVVMEALHPVEISIEDQVRTKWARFTAEREDAATDADDRPVVNLGGDDRAVLAAVADALLARGNASALYRQGRALITIDGPASAERVAVELADAILFQRNGEGCGVPVELARKISARPPELPELRCRRAAPVLRPDGSVFYDRGYDGVTGTWCDGWSGPRVPEGPIDQAMAAAAAARLIAFVHGDAWVAGSDWAAWLSHALTVAARPAIAGNVPAFVYTSAAPGSGKTTLARVAGVLGARCGDFTDPSVKDDAELARRLDDFAGRPAVVLDNVHGTLRSPLLEGAITGGTLAVRRLYIGPVTVPWSAVLAATSNGAQLGQDWARRSVPVRLNSKPPDAGRNVLREAEGRLDLTEAALTVVAGWLRSGLRSQATALASFDEWSAIVAGAIRWALGIDLVPVTRDAAAAMVAGEDDGGELLDSIERWLAASGKTEASAREMWDAPSLYSAREGFANVGAFGARLGRLSDPSRAMEVRRTGTGRYWRVVRR